MFKALAGELAGALVRVTLERIDAEINLWLKRILVALDLDRSTIAEIDPGTGAARVTYGGWVRKTDGIVEIPSDAETLIPWIIGKVQTGKTTVIDSVEKLPNDAKVDRNTLRRFGTGSSVMVPIKVGAKVIAGMSFATLRREHRWPPHFVYESQKTG